MSRKPLLAAPGIHDTLRSLGSQTRQGLVKNSNDRKKINKRFMPLSPLILFIYSSQPGKSTASALKKPRPAFSTHLGLYSIAHTVSPNTRNMP